MQTWPVMHLRACGYWFSVHSRVVPNNSNGTMSLSAIEACIRSDDVHFPVTRVVCLETTHNRCGGRVLSVEYIASVAALCRARGLALHVDGARIMNAIQKLKVDPAVYCKDMDSVSVCLSKGLGAPVGSLIVGRADFVHKARRYRTCARHSLCVNLLVSQDPPSPQLVCQCITFILHAGYARRWVAACDRRACWQRADCWR